MTATTDMRDAYLTAELELIQNGRTNAIGDRTLTRADLPDIRRGRQEWEARARAEAAASVNAPGLPHSLANLTLR